SGKLAGTNRHVHFVPPVFDMLIQESFFLHEEEQINKLNRQITDLEGSPSLSTLLRQLTEAQQNADEELKTYRLHMKVEKAKRKKIRANTSARRSTTHYQLLDAALIQQSYRDQHEHAVLKTKWTEHLPSIEALIQDKQQQLEDLRNRRKLKSATLQQRL